MAGQPDESLIIIESLPCLTSHNCMVRTDKTLLRRVFITYTWYPEWPKSPVVTSYCYCWPHICTGVPCHSDQVVVSSAYSGPRPSRWQCTSCQWCCCPGTRARWGEARPRWPRTGWWEDRPPWMDPQDRRWTTASLCLLESSGLMEELKKKSL